MIASLYLAPHRLSIDLQFALGNAVDMAREAMDNLAYTFGGRIEVADMVAESDYSVVEMAADEIFDLTNNPSRQEEREMKYGRGRSMSVGDVVRVGNEMVVCMSCGWEKL